MKTSKFGFDYKTAVSDMSVNERVQNLESMITDSDRYLYEGKDKWFLFLSNEEEHLAYMEALWVGIPEELNPLTEEDIKMYEEAFVA